jgi:hypothetical protein
VRDNRRPDMDERSKYALRICRIGSYEDVQVSRSARRSVCSDRVRTDDNEVALLLAHAAHEIDEVLRKLGRHRSRRSTRPGMLARVYVGIARPENAH